MPQTKAGGRGPRGRSEQGGAHLGGAVGARAAPGCRGGRGVVLTVRWLGEQCIFFL